MLGAFFGKEAEEEREEDVAVEEEDDDDDDVIGKSNPLSDSDGDLDVSGSRGVTSKLDIGNTFEKMPELPDDDV
jgi:hypothetical protein